MLAALLLVPPRVSPDEFTDQLARLRAPRAEERASAERWLASHLAADRYPELAEAALAADAEVRGRLERVLASDSRHLALALSLGAERDAGLRQLGQDAVRAGVARAEPRLTEPALRQGLDVFLRRAAEATPPRNLRLSAGLELEAMLEELELAGELPLGLTLDASAASRSFRRPEDLSAAPWNRMILRLRELGVEIEGHGVVPPREGSVPAGAFLRFATELGPVRTGADWVTDWLLVLARAEASQVERARAARNLASSGFAPALAWMEGLAWMDGRVGARADRAARDGLLRAAARGRVAPVLATPAVLQACLAEAEEAGGRPSARILAALARVGCVDQHGESLAGSLLADFQAASPRGRWIRLHVLERNRCTPEEAGSVARALLADPATPAPLALQALHLSVVRGEAAPGGPVRIATLPALLRLELDASESERLGRALRLAEVDPPFPDPGEIPPDWDRSARARLLEAWLWNGDEERAARHAAAWLDGAPEGARERGEALALALKGWAERGEQARLARVLARVRGSRVEAGAERVRLLLGLVPGSEVPAVVARTGLATSGKDADLAVLGALAGYPQAMALETQARETLRALLAAAAKEQRPLAEVGPLLAAAERAVAGLFTARRDAEGFAFARALWQIQSKGESPLARELARSAWLVPVGVELRDLGRELARHAPPALL